MEYTQEEAFAAIGQLYLRAVKLEQIIATQQQAIEANKDTDGEPTG